MDAVDARRILGVGAGATDVEVRAAYRAALLRTHPDLHGGDGGPIRQVVESYRLLRTASAEPEPGPEVAVPVPTLLDDAEAVVVDGDTVAAELPAGDLFAMLLEVGHRIGEVSYADPQAGLLEVVIELPGYGACSVVLTLQGRATGTTEASCTVEPLGGGPSPPAAAVAELLAAGLRTVC